MIFHIKALTAMIRTALKTFQEIFPVSITIGSKISIFCLFSSEQPFLFVISKINVRGGIYMAGIIIIFKKLSQCREKSV